MGEKGRRRQWWPWKKNQPEEPRKIGTEQAVRGETRRAAG